VAKLASGELFDSGSHTLQWNAEDVPSGVYLIRLATPQTSVTTKAILLK